MTNGTDRIDRIEAILAEIAESQRRTQQQQEVNTGAISGLRRSVQEVNTSVRLTNEQLNASIADTVAMIGSLAEQQEQRHNETDQRFNNLLADSRSDRQNNEREHQAFRESFQSLLGEIRAIWERLAG